MVAIKVILADRAEPADLARFEREIAFTGEIEHPNVVNVIEEGITDEGLRYMAIPFYAWCQTHPQIRFQGPAGSGKSTGFVFLDAIISGNETT